MNTITTRGVTEVSEDFSDGVSELSSRSANGVDVALLWRRRDNRATVVVVDHRTGEEFVLDVHDNDNALDIFHHPYAYAAHRQIDHRSPADREHLQIAA
jgi:hypothetical protein